jgi:hypothetical protein
VLSAIFEEPEYVDFTNGVANRRFVRVLGGHNIQTSLPKYNNILYYKKNTNQVFE